jgi:hypothetical protein
MGVGARRELHADAGVLTGVRQPDFADGGVMTPTKIQTSLVGFLRETRTGRIVVDLCPSDAEHIVAPTPEGSDRRTCRTDLLDLIPREWLGKKYRVKVIVEIEPE